MSEQAKLDLDAIQDQTRRALMPPMNAGITATLESHRRCREAVANVQPLCDEVERLRARIAELEAEAAQDAIQESFYNDLQRDIARQFLPAEVTQAGNVAQGEADVAGRGGERC